MPASCSSSRGGLCKTNRERIRCMSRLLVPPRSLGHNFLLLCRRLRDRSSSQNSLFSQLGRQVQLQSPCVVTRSALKRWRPLLCMTYPPWFLAKFWKWLIFSCDPTLLIHWTLRLKTTSALSWISPCLNPGRNYFGKHICSSCLPFELLLWYGCCTCVRCVIVCVTHATQGFGKLTVDSWRPSASKSCVFRPLSTVQLGGLFSEAFWKFSFIFGNVPKKYINLPEACAQYTHLTWSTTWPAVAKF